MKNNKKVGTEAIYTGRKDKLYCVIGAWADK